MHGDIYCTHLVIIFHQEKGPEQEQETFNHIIFLKCGTHIVSITLALSTINVLVTYDMQ